ncbi:hypothetical protein TS71_20730 [Mycolicibacterium neoaurum]|nr:hypothetical protein D174_04240 [Mycolicibacterium neoaurum VKM Ac-1815D]AMO08043.1 hypothetical protein MyAD_04150 [Mycolicibacterium neoaurum]AXK78631.1 DUF2742 domain-containing protein [Mycolicibacterium neoaurum]KJQ48601.1 hypothetical protein TS71_20730 [Mycolicibacterium neoaurum]KUM06991.1 hypothetical protein AVZ31_18900 [Mycolicibacterium neoaurum]
MDWFPVHRLVTPIVDQFETLPVAGTLPWQELADTDPAKWASVLDVARYGALHLQLRQEALAEASRDISASTDWTAIARRHRADRGRAYIPRRRAS